MGSRRRWSVPRPCRRGGDQAGGQARTPESPRDRRQRRNAEPAELPVRARHVDHSGVDAAGPAPPPGLPLPVTLVPPMALSRLVLGVHYPSDVLTGVAVGAVVAKTVGAVADRVGGDG